MDWCIQQGRDAFDFMRGDEEYKYHFGGVDRFVLKATLSQK
jgi:CelD/BcsL family acetyltransferase involved in cellulose biosynthesis